MRKLIIVLLISLGCQGLLRSQELDYNAANIDNMVQPSPTVSALGKFVDIPVSNYTGTPEISIPIWNLKGKTLSVPISLDYHASGVKVEEIAGWVGMGWSLSGGGVISRVKRGMEDELIDVGYFDLVHEFEEDFWGWLNDFDYEVREDIVNGKLRDTEPDMFTFSFPGYSGKFFYDSENRGIVSIPYQKLKIEYIRPDQFENVIHWIITDGNGIIYTFDQRESTTIGAETHVSSWHLSKIYDPINNDSISFTYHDITENYDFHKSVTNYIMTPATESCCPNYYDSSRPVSQSVSANTKKLKSISSSLTSVEFNITEGRDDYRDNTGCKLDAIIISDRISSSNILNFQLNYTMYSSSTVVGVISSQSYETKRLFLDSLYQFKETKTNNHYCFEYENPGGLPARNSCAQDYWGFFNNEDNSTLIPYLFYSGPDGTMSISGADRLPDFNYGKLGILKKITYPTGGYSEFNHEPHDYGYVKNQRVAGDTNYVSGTNVQSVTVGNTGTIIDFEPFYFTVGHEQVGTVNFTIPENNTGFKFNITNITTNTTVNTFLKDPIFDIMLEPGDYEVTSETDGLDEDDQHKTVAIEITYVESVIEYNDFEIISNPIAGGVRISSIETYDPVRDSIMYKRFEYKKYDDELEKYISSGSLVNEPPNYYYDYKTSYCDGDFPCNLNIDCNYIIVSSQSIGQIGTTSGSHVGYSEVTVLEGEEKEKFVQVGLPEDTTQTNNETNNLKGKTVYKYTSNIDYPEEEMNTYPSGYGGEHEWKRGKLTELSLYNSENELLKKEEYSYDTFASGSSYRSKITGRRLYFRKKDLCYLSQNTQDDHTEIMFRAYSYWSDIFVLTNKKATEYFYDDQNINSIVTNESFEYNNPEHLQLTSSITSNGIDEIEIKTKYVHDLNDTLEDRFNNLHLFTKPVSKEKYKNGIITDGVLIDYNAKGFAVQQQNMELIDSYNAQLGWEKIPNYYISRELKYSENNNLVELENVPGDFSTLAWGYNKSLPIAKVIGANEEEVYFQNFEDGVSPTDVWDGTGCGTVSVGNDYVIEQRALYPGEQYVLSYYKRGFSSSEWEFVVDTFETAQASVEYRDIVIQGAFYIDDVKFHPTNSQMFTYAYNPGVGLRRVIEPNNKSTFYEYDEFGRLALIKDNNGNILKSYNYYIQQNLPSFNTQPVSQSICEGNSVFFDVEASGTNISYQWLKDGVAISGANSSSYTIGSALSTDEGEYSCVITDLGSDLSIPSNNATLTVDSAPFAPGTISGADTVCSGSTETYSISSVSGAITYEWTVPSDATIISGQLSTSITVEFGSTSGNVSVRATNNCGNSAYTYKSVTINSEPSVPETITGVDNTCSGSTETYLISSVTGATNYSWAVPSDATIIQDNGTAIVVEFGSNGGFVAVSAENDCEGSPYNTKYVTVGSAPSAPETITGVDNTCSGDTETYLISSVTGATSYSWEVPSGSTITSGQGTTSITVNFGSTSGNVSVRATNNCGNSTYTSKGVTVDSAPSVPGTISGASTACIGDTKTYSISSVSGAITYEWTVPSDATIISGQLSTSITVEFGSTSGNVSVRATNNCGNSAYTYKSVTISSEPSAPGTITGVDNACIGDTETYLISSVTGATNYSWAVPSDATIIQDNGTAIVVEFGSNGGFVAVSAENDCGVSPYNTKYVTVGSVPSVPGTISGATTACSGDTKTYSIFSVIGATNYTWTVPTGATITSGQGTTSITVNFGSTSGNVSVKAGNECGYSAYTSKAVTVSSAPSVPGTISGESSVHSGDTETYSISSVSGATNYTWTVPTGATITSGQGTTSITVNFGSTSGNVSVRAENGCGNSAYKTKTVNITNLVADFNFILDDLQSIWGTTYIFTDESIGTPTSWAWDFDGDGDIESTLQNPTYTFSSEQEVTLTVTNSGGSDSVTKTIKPLVRVDL